MYMILKLFFSRLISSQLIQEETFFIFERDYQTLFSKQRRNAGYIIQQKQLLIGLVFKLILDGYIKINT